MAGIRGGWAGGRASEHRSNRGSDRRGDRRNDRRGDRRSDRRGDAEEEESETKRGQESCSGETMRLSSGAGKTMPDLVEGDRGELKEEWW